MSTETKEFSDDDCRLVEDLVERNTWKQVLEEMVVHAQRARDAAAERNCGERAFENWNVFVRNLERAWSSATKVEEAS